MTDDRYEQLNPPHLVAALRSFPRRYREALATVPPEPEALVRPIDGHTVLALIADTAHTLELLDHALERTLVHDEPELAAEVVDASTRRWPASKPSEATLFLEQLSARATVFADRIDRAPAGDWSRTAQVDGHAVRAIDLARDAVRTGAENLRLIERMIPMLG